MGMIVLSWKGSTRYLKIAAQMNRRLAGDWSAILATELTPHAWSADEEGARTVGQEGVKNGETLKN